MAPTPRPGIPQTLSPKPRMHLARCNLTHRVLVSAYDRVFFVGLVSGYVYGLG